ncbi:type II toxin-antitoxin system Phd/YefM family antitoxin [Mesoaciditoga lauensis]|uniref:type II toxin-antitoxin system Phd/YefM family antitoxin n=1 Tax=Mesoaciditoga lauensis TaxID=1495039 RepID=UPI000568D59F|nr:type II toxin-antitoxin system Phd/YefM family antitoxin [Mesoaciditoga lauensis]
MKILSLREFRNNISKHLDEEAIILKRGIPAGIYKPIEDPTNALLAILEDMKEDFKKMGINEEQAKKLLKGVREKVYGKENLSS